MEDIVLITFNIYKKETINLKYTIGKLMVSCYLI